MTGNSLSLKCYIIEVVRQRSTTDNKHFHIGKILNKMAGKTLSVKCYIIEAIKRRTTRDNEHFHSGKVIVEDQDTVRHLTLPGYPELDDGATLLTVCGRSKHI